MAYISIIVPCYNAETYVDRCLTTLVNQTIGIDNLEIILVNDASTDNTLDLLKKWEHLYPEQIMVISYENNLRQGGARNVGLQYSTCEYVGFVDIDDWVSPHMYESLWTHTRNGHFDTVKGKLIREHYPNESTIVSSNREDQQYEFSSIDGFYIPSVSSTGNNGEYSTIVTAIYRKSIIEENDIYFPEGLAYEDNYWGNLIQYYCRNLYIVDDIVYHYYINMNSTSTVWNAPHHFDRLQIELLKLDTFKARGIYPHFKTEIEWNFIQLFYLNSMYIFFMRFDYIPDVINEMRHIVVDNFPNYKSNPNYNKCNAREQALLSLLDIPRDLTDLELAKIKLAYVESLTQ